MIQHIKSCYKSLFSIGLIKCFTLLFALTFIADIIIGRGWLVAIVHLVTSAMALTFGMALAYKGGGNQ